MELREAWAALRHGWWVCIAGLLAGAALSLGNSMLTTPQYTAQLQLFVSTPNTSISAAEALQGSQFSEQRVTSYAQLITGDALARSVVEDLGLDMTPSELTSRVTASGVTDTVLIDVSVSDPSPQRAQAIAQAIGELFPDQVDALEESGSGGASLVKVTVTQDAELPTSPSSPQTARDVAVGALAGLVLGAVVSVGWLGRRRSATRPEQLEETSGAPVLAVLPRGDARQAPLRRLALDVLPLRSAPTSRGHLVVVTATSAAHSGDGVARGLATALAETGRRVTLVDADPVGGRTTRQHDVSPSAGLTGLLAGTATADQVRVRTAFGYDLVPVGDTGDQHQRLLLSPELPAKLADLLAGQDAVVVAAAALAPTSDALGLVSCADEVLLTVLDGRTRTDEIVQARRTIDQLVAPLTGLVLVQSPERGRRRDRRSQDPVADASPPGPEEPASTGRPEPGSVLAGPVPPPADPEESTGTSSELVGQASPSSPSQPAGFDRLLSERPARSVAPAPGRLGRPRPLG